MSATFTHTSKATTNTVAAAQEAEPEWMRIPAAVKAFAISRSKLYELIDAGRIKSVCLRDKGKTRGIRLIAADSIRELLNKAAAGEAI